MSLIQKRKLRDSSSPRCTGQPAWSLPRWNPWWFLGIGFLDGLRGTTDFGLSTERNLDGREPACYKLFKSHHIRITPLPKVRTIFPGGLLSSIMHSSLFRFGDCGEPPPRFPIGGRLRGVAGAMTGEMP